MKFTRSVFVTAFCLTIVATSAAQSPSAAQDLANQDPTSGFTQLAQLSTSDGYKGYFGAAIAISSDGNTVAVGRGSPGYLNGPGAVYVYTKPASGWANMTQVAKLTASEGDNNDYLGESVAVSPDGSTIVAGAPDAHNGQGAAYVFVKPASGWTNMTETAQLIGSDAYQVMGSSVAMSGNTVVVGANNPTNAAYVFVEPPTGWANMTQTAKLTSSFASAPGFGGRVAIDGNVIVVGGCSGQAFLFVEPKTGWTNGTQTARLSLPQGSASDSVAVSGNTVVVGYPWAEDGLDEPYGAAYVFVEPATGWKTMGSTATLTASDNKMQGWVGWSVAIQGNEIFAGAPCTAVTGSGLPCQGAVYQFTEPSTGWQTTSAFNAKIVQSAATKNPGEFGFSVALGGNYLVAGAPYGDLGMAYVLAP
jgi:hypothetical protein